MLRYPGLDKQRGTGRVNAGSQPVETVTVDHVDSPANPVTTAAFGVLNLVTVAFSIDAIERSRLSRSPPCSRPP